MTMTDKTTNDAATTRDRHPGAVALGRLGGRARSKGQQRTALLNLKKARAAKAKRRAKRTTTR
jgi:hypothetical protein